MKIGAKIINLESVDSTNNYAANMILEGNCPHGTVILADEQYLGRGQRGSKWFAASGDNLTTSIVLLPDNLSVEQQFYLTCITSLSVLDVLKEFNIAAEIKWPNDIYVKDRKIAGILIENAIQGNWIKSAIIGIGLNVNSCPSIDGTTCIFDQILLKIQPFQVLTKFLIHFNRWYEEHQVSNHLYIIEKYRDSLFKRNKTLVFEDEDGIFEGNVLDVSEHGYLQLRVGNEIRSYGAKQISWRLESVI
jgi:BirA family biotin operon repressor/biotin-[acetyl-CoA-carboxylase] ligase